MNRFDADFRMFAWIICGMLVVWTTAMLLLTADEFRTDRQARPVNLQCAQPGEFVA